MEDVPYFDLTTHALEIGEKKGEIHFYSREHGVLAGAEEVEAICLNHGLKIEKKASTGDLLSPQETFFSVTGPFSTLYKIYKVCQNIFEYASGIATKTNRFVRLTKEINEDISVFTTRKTFPGTKKLVIKSVIAGGGLPHRLGLSETILIFKHHINFCNNEQELKERINKIKKTHCSKKIFIEAETVQEALFYANLAIDGIQYDKFSTEELQSTVKEIRNSHPHLVHLATGGINEDNIQAYAATGVDGIVTTAVYFSKPLDVGVNITPINND